MAAAVWPSDYVRQTGRRVVVLGAGMAGLTAAAELVTAGFSVTVLEARLRPGGRVQTLREPFAEKLYAEAGAIFIYDVHTLVLKAVREVGLTLDPVAPRHLNGLYHVRGRLVRVGAEGAASRFPFQLSPDEARRGLGGMYAKYLEPLYSTPQEAASLSWPPDRLKEYDRLTLSELLQSRGASEEAIALMRLGYFDLVGDGASACSALAYIRDASLLQGASKHYTIRGGNDQLPHEMALRLRAPIHYGAEVKSIERRASTVRVGYLQNAELRELAADHMVCTIPYSVLRTLNVSPAFSPEKLRAITELGHTSVTRVFLQERTRSWLDQGISGAATTDLPIMWTRDVSFNQPGPRGILEAYTAGPQARKLAAMPDAERIAHCAEQMEKVYPGSRENCEGGTAKCWDADPFSRGDYAWLRPGQTLSLGPFLAKPEGRVHFAGDQTSASPGWMQGAIESGLRAAREIIGA